MRSNATAKDLPDASFAWQQEIYLDVQGHQALLETCKRCFASLFIERFDHLQIALSSGVQQ